LFAKNIEGGRSWLIVLHHHCRNSSRLISFVKSNLRTLQEQNYFCSLFILFLTVYFYSLKSALPNFIQKNTAGSAFYALSDKIYLALNLNMGEALWI